MLTKFPNPAISRSMLWTGRILSLLVIMILAVPCIATVPKPILSFHATVSVPESDRVTFGIGIELLSRNHDTNKTITQ